uniref:Uncharacterized protein n=1 Tax=Glossina pallidipes TaxID=7398 RepID=A0A1A9ZUV3_GLOPL
MLNTVNRMNQGTLESTIKEHFKYVQLGVQHHKDSNCGLYVPKDFKTRRYYLPKSCLIQDLVRKHLKSQIYKSAVIIDETTSHNTVNKAMPFRCQIISEACEIYNAGESRKLSTLLNEYECVFPED